MDLQLLQSLPGPLLRLHRALPIAVQDNTLLLGMEDPADLAIQETVRRLTGREVKVVQLCADGGELPAWEQIPPTPAPGREPEAFQLLDSRLEVRITGSLVWVKLSQNFSNTRSEPTGGIYLVPIPHGALLQGLWADQAGRPLQLGNAERVSLAGQSHLSTSLTVEAQVRLTVNYVHTLEREGNGFRITLPCPHDSQSLDSSIVLHWPGLLPQHLSCSRPATWTRQQADQVEIKLQPGKEPCRRPLIFHYRAPQVDKSLQGLLLSDGQHFLLHLQAPPQLEPPPRNVLFLLDRSASLEGWGAEQGRRALVHALRQLRPLDRFALALFDDGVECWQKGRWVGAGAVLAAKEWLQQQARGGGTTDIVQALEWVRHFYRDQPDLYLVILSDGQGGRQSEALRLASALGKSLRIFTLSLGSHSQKYFLRRLAELGGGSAEVAVTQDLSSGVERLIHQLGEPILSNMQLVGQGFHCDPAQQYPERLSEIFSGQHLTVLGRHQGIGPLIARGLSSRGPISLTLTPRMVDHPALAALWAQAQREGLQRRLGPAREADRNRLVEQLHQLGRNYSLDPTCEGVLFRWDFWRPAKGAPVAADDCFELAEELLEQAAGRQASHIHIELQSDQVKIRLRVCGKLQVLATPFEDQRARGLIAQFRHWCQLDPSQGQFQSGRFQRPIQDEEFRFEASFCPTINGEKLVLEVRPARLRSHACLAEPARSAVSALFTRRRGLILVCGPKGSGGNSLMVDWLGSQFADRHAVLCHKEEWFGLRAATQVVSQQDLTSLLQELEGHDIDVLACTAARRRCAWESLLRRAGERSLVLARHHAPQAGAALAELLEQGIDGRVLGKAILGAISLRRVPRLCTCKIPESDAQILRALPAEGNYARKEGCRLCQGEGVRGSLLCSEVLLYRSEIFSVLKPGIKADQLEQAFIRYPMQQQLLRLAQQGLIEARDGLSLNNTF